MIAASILPLFLAVFACIAQASEFPEKLDFAGVELVPHGTAQAHYLFWHVYDAALYLPVATPSQRALEADTTKCLDIAYRRHIAAADLRRSAEQVLKRQLTQNALRRISNRLARLDAAYRDVERGDRYRLCYARDHGTTLFRNGKTQINIPGADFATAYFGIWLGAVAPLSAEVRDELLAGQ